MFGRTFLEYIINYCSKRIWFWVDFKKNLKWYSFPSEERESLRESVGPQIVTKPKLVTQHDDKSSEVHKY